MKTSTKPTPSRPAQALSLRRMGLAFSTTGVLFYLGCMLTMATVPHEQAVLFFNSLLHGIDVEPILRERVSLLEVCLGLASTFVLGWLAGALLAGIYNLGRRPAP
jgi:hypothetical protein